MVQRETACSIWDPIITQPPVAALPIHWLFIYNLDMWECMLVEWSLCPEKTSAAARVVDGSVLDLRKGIAQQCFGDLPMRPLEQFVHYFKVEMPETKTLVNVLTALCCHILELEPTSDEMLQILEKRLLSANVQFGLDVVETIVLDDNETVALDKFDEEDLKKKLENTKTKSAELQTFREDMKTKRNDNYNFNNKKKKPKATGTPKYRGPIKVPQGTGMNLEELRAILPPGYRAMLDHHEARWAVSHKDPKFFCSKSWGKYGYRESALMACQAAWAHTVEHKPWLTCPIRDLFPPSPQASQEGEGASASSASGSKRQRLR